MAVGFFVSSEMFMNSVLETRKLSHGDPGLVANQPRGRGAALDWETNPNIEKGKKEKMSEKGRKVWRVPHKHSFVGMLWHLKHTSTK